jgi:hypothetical protein
MIKPASGALCPAAGPAGANKPWARRLGRSNAGARRRAPRRHDRRRGWVARVDPVPGRTAGSSPVNAPAAPQTTHENVVRPTWRSATSLVSINSTSRGRASQRTAHRTSRPCALAFDQAGPGGTRYIFSSDPQHYGSIIVAHAVNGARGAPESRTHEAACGVVG